MELSPSWEATNCASTKKFPAFYGTRRFITVFTRTLHWSISWARSIQSLPFYTISLRSILILSTHLCLSFPSGLFPTNILYEFIFSPSCYMRCLSHPLWLDHSNYTWRRIQISGIILNDEFIGMSEDISTTTWVRSVVIRLCYAGSAGTSCQPTRWDIPPSISQLITNQLPRNFLNFCYN
jgi:hypothetical protein